MYKQSQGATDSILSGFEEVRGSHSGAVACRVLMTICGSQDPCSGDHSRRPSLVAVR